MNADVMGVLNEFDIKNPEDLGKVGLEVVHERCGAVVCGVYDGDTLSALATVADHHHCPADIDVAAVSAGLADLRAPLSTQ